ncbi:MAG: glutathione peroxidase [Bdellovibrionaceae bacterium]|nr:glutathione peroxidase [Pseudobdellovibrionaceae bacterium]
MKVHNIIFLAFVAVASQGFAASAKVKKEAAKAQPTAPSPAVQAQFNDRGAAIPETGFYSFVVKDAEDKEVHLSDYKGKVVLVVNVASKCGFTGQYEGLEKLYKDYSAKGLVVLGFPSNQFHGQEPGTNKEIQQFCKLTYGVNFPVFAKVDVNGDNAIPLYKWLKSQKGFEGDIGWNFNKFLINQSGQVVQRYASTKGPASIEPEIKKLLK